MKIELEDLDSTEGCLLRLGNLSLMFSTRLEAQQFVDRLQGRIGAIRLGRESELMAGRRDDPPAGSVS